MAASMQLPRKEKEYKPRKVQSMDTYRYLFRFHDENVSWMLEYFLGENTETRGDALSNKQKMEVFLQWPRFPNWCRRGYGNPSEYCL